MPYPSAADYTVQILTSAGAAVDTFGGGVQYSDGTAAATPTGTAVAWNDVGTERIASAAKPLPVNVVAGSGSGLSVVDAAAWTTAVSNFVPGGGVFNDSAAALASGTQGTLRMTAQRAQHANIRNNTGTELGVAANPFVVGGAKTNNNAVPGATNLGTLPAVANAAAPTWVETNQVGLSVDLAGNLRTTGAVTGSGTFTVAGAKTNNNAAPGATNVGVFPAIANAAAPSWTETNLVGLSVDLAGNLRTTGAVTGSGTFTVAGAKTNNNAAPGATNVGVFPAIANAAAPSWTEGNLVGLSTDLAGQLRISGPTTTAGTTAAGGAAPNPVGIGFLGTGSTLRNLTGANQVTATTGNDLVGVGPLVYSTTGPTWDRMRDANSVSGTGGTGLLGTGPLVWDGTNWQRWAQVTPSSATLPAGTGIGTTTFGIWTGGSVWTAPIGPGNIGDASSASGSLAVGNYLYGAANSWDRMRSANFVAATTGTGLLGAGGMVFDGTNWQKRAGDTSGRTTVVGPGANQAAVVGNPVWMAASTTAAGGNLQGTIVESVSNPNLRVSLYSTTNQAQIQTNGNADGFTAGQWVSLCTGSLNMGYNNSSIDRQRHNIDVSLLTSAARTTIQQSDVTTYNTVGLTVVLDMTVVGTGSVTVTVDGKDLNSAKYYNLFTGAAITTNSTNTYRIQPGLTAVANVDVNARLPRVIRITVTHNNANSATYSCSYCLHN